MAVTVYAYASCDTCRKALKWLDAQGIAYDKRPIATSPPDAAEIERIVALSGVGLGRFFNTSGGSYRQGDWSARRKTLSEAEQIGGLAADGMLIKRPIVVGDGFALVGFKEAEYAAAFKK